MREGFCKALFENKITAAQQQDGRTIGDRRTRRLFAWAREETDGNGGRKK